MFMKLIAAAIRDPVVIGISAILGGIVTWCATQWPVPTAGVVAVVGLLSLALLRQSGSP